MLVVALMVAEGNVAIILAALTGACIGFLPYNFNPAKLFMGDTGSQLLGYVLATVSVMGMGAEPSWCLLTVTPGGEFTWEFKKI